MQLKTEEMSPKMVNTPNSKKGNPNKKAKLEQTPNKKQEATTSPSLSKSEKKKMQRQKLKETAGLIQQKNTSQNQTPKQKSKKRQKNGVGKQTERQKKDFTIAFPTTGTECCKAALLQVISLCDKIRSPKFLCVEFSSAEEAIEKSKLIRKIQLNGQGLSVIAQAEESDPIKRIAYIPNETILDSVKKFFNPVDLQPIGSQRKNKGRRPLKLYVLTFKNAQEAAAAEQKEMPVDTGSPIILRPFFNRKKLAENLIAATPEKGSLKRKLDETEPAKNQKKQNQQKKVELTQQKDDDDEENDDDEEEDDDEQEMEDDDEESDAEEDDEDDDDE